MSKQAKVVVGIIAVVVIAIGIGGYFWYQANTGSPGLDRQRERILPKEGPAVHPSQQTPQQ